MGSVETAATQATKASAETTAAPRTERVETVATQATEAATVSFATTVAPSVAPSIAPAQSIAPVARTAEHVPPPPSLPTAPATPAATPRPSSGIPAVDAETVYVNAGNAPAEEDALPATDNFISGVESQNPSRIPAEWMPNSLAKTLFAGLIIFLILTILFACLYATTQKRFLSLESEAARLRNESRYANASRGMAVQPVDLANGTAPPAINDTGPPLAPVQQSTVSTGSSTVIPVLTDSATVTSVPTDSATVTSVPTDTATVTPASTDTTGTDTVPTSTDTVTPASSTDTVPPIPASTTADHPEQYSCGWFKTCNRTGTGAPPLLVISMDGFAQRFLERKMVDIINKVKECGAHASHVRPSFPPKTFVNHYSIATGLRADKHGIVDNKFYLKNAAGFGPDEFNPNIGSRFDQNTQPIWNTVVYNGKESKVFYWPGSDDKINNTEPTFAMKFDTPEFPLGSAPYTTVVETVAGWLLADNPPALSMFYLHRPDREGHNFGPDSGQENDDLMFVDATLGYLLRLLYEGGALGCTNILLVADHGMSNITKVYEVKTDLPSTWAASKPFNGSFANLMLYEYTNAQAAEDELKCGKGEFFKVYHGPDTVPYRLHYDHPNVAYPFVRGRTGVMFKADGTDAPFAEKGNHGWDNQDVETESIFVGIGPSLNENVTVPPFQNTEFYNLFCDLMQLSYCHENDGNRELLWPLLKHPPQPVAEKRTAIPPCPAPKFTACAPECNQYAKAGAFAGIATSEETGRCSIQLEHSSLVVDATTKAVLLLESIVDSGMTAIAETCAVTIDATAAAVVCAAANTDRPRLVPKIHPSSVLLLAHEGPDILFTMMDRFGGAKSQRRTRILAGTAYDKNAKFRGYFAVFVRCVNDDWTADESCAKAEEGTEILSFIIPNEKAFDDNFDCLTEDDYLRDNVATLQDVEELSGFSLLPPALDPIVAARIRTILPNASLWF